jgi:hypothetical protein
MPKTPPPTVPFNIRDLTSPPVPQRLSWSSMSPPSDQISASRGSQADASLLQNNANATVESIGPRHLCIYKVRLPARLIELLDPLIERAEAHAMNLPLGWKTDLYSLTNQDLAVQSVPGGPSLCQPIADFVCRTIQSLYGAAKVELDQNQPHILKYSATDGHVGVSLHHDHCTVTANLMMSDSRNYIGGGTVFAAFNTTVHLEKGEFLLHPGNLIHGGRNIESGNRYLLVFFCNIGEGEI